MNKQLSAAIGNTPLASIPFKTPATIYAKLEYFNLGGSVKDRTALFMIENAEKTGQLKPGGTIIDASSGNFGIAAAMIGAAKGYKVIIITTEKCSQEKLQTMKAYGAKIIICPVTEFIENPQSFHSVAVQLNKETPNSFMPDQYFNIQNAQAHYVLTGPEIWRQTKGRITHFFAAAGTGGTITGVGRYLKEQSPRIKIMCMDSINSFRSTNGNPKPYKVEGMGIDWVSKIIDYTVIDEFITVSDNDAFAMVNTLAHEYGILAGLTSGAVAWGVHSYLPKLKRDDLAVMIFGDSGRAYLSKIPL